MRAAQRQNELVELGKSLIKTEVDGPEVDGKPTKMTEYSLPPTVEAPAFNNPPHLLFAVGVSGGRGYKQHPHHFARMKNRPGNKELHAEAIVEDASRTFTKECDKAMSVPAVNGEPLTQE